MGIIVSSRAKKDLLLLDKETRRKIYDTIYKLADDPKILYIKKLRGSTGVRRLRVGNYSILYKQDKDIIIINIKHRKDVYRNL